jgi:hypothetical protein
MKTTFLFTGWQNSFQAIGSFTERRLGHPFRDREHPIPGSKSINKEYSMKQNETF